MCAKETSEMSKKELIEYADNHILNGIRELILLAATAKAKKGKNENLIGEICNNAILTSFAIHARNLIDFLDYKKRKIYLTDITIEDYVLKDDLSKIPELTEMLKKTKLQVDKHVAHFTTDRIGYEIKGITWEYVKITQEILNLFFTAASHFERGKISDNFLNEITSKKVHVPRITLETDKKYITFTVAEGEPYEIDRINLVPPAELPGTQDSPQPRRPEPVE